MMRENNGAAHMRLKNEILIEMSRRGAIVWNNPTGVFFTRTGQPVRIGTAGAPDIMGVLPSGRAVAIEVKTGSGRLSKEQIIWRDALLAHNAVYIECRDINQLIF